METSEVRLVKEAQEDTVKKNSCTLLTNYTTYANIGGRKVKREGDKMRKYWKLVYPLLTVVVTAFGIIYGKRIGVDHLSLLLVGFIGMIVTLNTVIACVDGEK